MTAHLEYLDECWVDPLLIADALPKLPKVGQTLRNGAILLDEEELRRYDHRRDTLVLCVTTEALAHHPFWIWHRLITTDSPYGSMPGYRIVDTTAWGEGFKTLDEAMTAFADRVTKRRHALEV